MKIGNYIIISDTHIGIVKDIYDNGVFIPNQSEKMAQKLNKLGTLTKSKKIVLLGDVKHKVSGFSHMEKQELEKFLKSLKFREIIIVKGNHDGNIERMIPPEMRKKVKVKKSMIIGKYFLTHGHRNVKTTKKIIVIGHNQPHVRFQDSMKAIYMEPVWVCGMLGGKLRGKKLIMMPAFNELCGATVVNDGDLLGPIAKLLKRSAHVFLLDGTDIGRLADFR